MVSARTLALAAAVLAPVAACALLSLLRAMVTNNNAALVLVLVVVAVAATGYRVAGLVAAVVSAASFDFFLTQPYLQFAISERDDIEAAVLLALIGLAVTEIALWGRRQQARASTRAGYLRGVISAARLAASGVTSASDLVELVARQIADILGLDDAGSNPGPRTPTGRGCRPTAASPGAAGSSTSTGKACRHSTPSSCR
jgi:K+-sensing histidine kinase KdpD